MVSENNDAPSYASYILRHELLPLLLGEDEEMILYWAGKALARKHKDITEETLASWFQEAGWGTLELQQEKRKEKTYLLHPPAVDPARPFSLEAGFLAQTAEHDKEMLAEATYVIKKKKPVTVEIKVQWDRKDIVTRNEDEQA
ncbi:DUF2507 domain-containing protein [Alkalicoccus urumqiensis]|uniref:DUF2507 domain-containing protein n=1 Tax=Alkalicoccus urumqiensis TaxID=1548213 RepID=A0A2P6MF62_ALKUR|nr:DUF2507 domain-containing protein [Alkalicoccus urumqiensis]PRO64942.1 DUF2507 domain-containing protein [Alkalicoccus urumqiensis]